MIPDDVKVEFLITNELCLSAAKELKCFAQLLELRLKKALESNPNANLEAVENRIRKIRITVQKFESLK